MAVFSHTRAFQNATPIGFRPGPPAAAFPPAIPRRLAGVWSIDPAGTLVWRWRTIAVAAAR